jgi:hypothetical protein
MRARASYALTAADGAGPEWTGLHFPGRMRALAALSLRTPNLRAVAKQAMKAVGLGT